uniref:Choline transporter-like protein n=1 Tax=Scleropages formosus TaxID=113540 RepID=A0A8C9S6J1_SCLFO
MGRKSEDSSSQYGEPAEYDPTFNGPIHNRSCTDIICCILFMAAIAGYMIVGILAWLYGDPRHVLYPRNSTGMFCGIGLNKGKPSVFYFDLLKCATATNVMAAALNGLQCPTTQVCVDQCPGDFWILSPGAYLPTAKAKDFFQQQYCVPSFNLSTTDLTAKEIVDKELCPSFYIPTSSVLGRCLPSLGLLNNIPSNFTLPGMASVNDTANALKNATSDVLSGFNLRQVGVRIFEDFASSWYWILIGLLIAMLLSLIFLLLLRFMAPVLVWLLIVGVLGVVAYGIWHCYWEYDNYKNSSTTISNLGFTTNFSAYLQVKETWLAFLIILCILEAILLLVLLFLRTRILIAIALIQESSKAVGHMMSTLLYPLVTFALLIVCIAYWGITALYLATSGAPIYKVVALNSSTNSCLAINGTETCDPLSFNSSAYMSCPSAQCIFIKYNTEGLFQQNLFNLQIYNVLAFLWCVNFVIALGQCTLAGAFASYYWAFSKPSDIPTFPLSQAFIRSLRYHVGSLAFGALILTIVQFIRIVLEYLDHKFRAAQNPCARFIMCCLKCCFWCLEKFIKFINRNAYIMIAIYGKNFCVSAKNAFSLLMRNILRVVVLDKVTDLLLLFGKLLVVGGVGVLAFFFFSGRIQLPGNAFNSQTLNYYWVPIITVIVGAYLIAHGFFSVYNMCVDTLFLCFCEYSLCWPTYV